MLRFLFLFFNPFVSFFLDFVDYSLLFFISFIYLFSFPYFFVGVAWGTFFGRDLIYYGFVLLSL